jgi:hypothetical protein
MNDSVKFWHHDSPQAEQGDDNWRKAEQGWDRRAAQLAKEVPLRTFKKNPNLPGIRKKARKNLSWNTLSYIHKHDYSGKLGRHFWQRPIKHGWNLVKTLLQDHSYRRDGDFFLYHLRNTDEFKSRLVDPNTVLVVGFSYCHKPFECPSGRFTDACVHDINSAVCGQCFIGKCVSSLPDARVVPLFITTVHYIGEKMIEAEENWPHHNVLFLITACELTLEMFGKLGNAVGLQGIGVRLDGQICNTMRAFEASEVGIKPGMAIVIDDTKTRMMDLFQLFSESAEFSDPPTEANAADSSGVRRHIIATDK